MTMLRRTGPLVVLAMLLMFGAAPEGALAKGKGKAKGKPAKADVVATVAANAEEAEFEVGDLVAGQHEVVGKVSATLDGDTLTVTYRTTGGWCMTETHLYVGAEPPTSLAPGQFKNSLAEESHDPLPCVTVDRYEVDVSGLDEICIAAHAVVRGSADASLQDLCSVLPDEITFQLDGQNLDPRLTYHRARISDPTGILDGLDVPGWCIDTSSGITSRGNTYTGRLYCPTDTLPADVLFPGNLDQVLYIVNHYEDGTPFGNDGDTFAMADIQRAIWNLMAGLPADGQTRFGQPGNVDKLQAILDDAALSGVGYEPGCGDLAGFVVQPYQNSPSDDLQILLFLVPLTCPEGEETAWAYGIHEDFSTAASLTAFDKKWGWTTCLSLSTD